MTRKKKQDEELRKAELYRKYGINIEKFENGDNTKPIIFSLA